MVPTLSTAIVNKSLRDRPMNNPRNPPTFTNKSTKVNTSFSEFPFTQNFSALILRTVLLTEGSVFLTCVSKIRKNNENEGFLP